jgi:hypothetical protein
MSRVAIFTRQDSTHSLPALTTPSNNSNNTSASITRTSPGLDLNQSTDNIHMGPPLEVPAQLGRFGGGSAEHAISVTN